MKNVSEIVDLASAYYGSAVLFAAIDCGVLAARSAGCGFFSTRVSPRDCWRRTARHIAIRRRGRRHWCREVRRI